MDAALSDAAAWPGHRPTRSLFGTTAYPFCHRWQYPCGDACASLLGLKQARQPDQNMKTIAKLAIAASMLALPLITFASKACDACCKDKGKTCASCCKDAGKKCGTDCCKGEKAVQK
jgi:hypothetical protein